jgi:hypothetical protein
VRICLKTKTKANKQTKTSKIYKKVKEKTNKRKYLGNINIWENYFVFVKNDIETGCSESHL